jgi:hypothetical protein
VEQAQANDAFACKDRLYGLIRVKETNFGLRPVRVYDPWPLGAAFAK